VTFCLVDRVLEQRFSALDRKAAFPGELAKYMRGFAVEQIQVGEVYYHRVRSISHYFVSDPREQYCVIAKHLATNTENRASCGFVSDLLNLGRHDGD